MKGLSVKVLEGGARRSVNGPIVKVRYAVDPIPQHRMPRKSQMHPDLVGTPRLEPERNEACPRDV